MAGHLKDLKLLPFYVTTGLFFWFAQPLTEHPEETVTSAILKVLPIWSLAFYVYTKHLASGKNESPYPSAFFVGLLLSSIGDILIVWHETLFDLGVAVFAAAHAFYLIGILSRYKGGASSTKLMYNLVILSFLLFVVGDIETRVDKVMCVVYFSFLGYIAWLTSAHDENEKSTSSFYARLGMCIFLLSDFVITTNRVMTSLPCCEFFVMVTYYAAQCCLALSTVQ
ncbi:lysoplasmalogenase-like protein TMEM86A [Gigantopelta aegis]|uniref:lysoplasmalogenase-like protein TMEM86A n=1 Tax=Gigantopelta aegis TaxID=1735272 RepID=UPI001B8879E2|nr:lysoplasmalogenase-like protein TMEM86A [Gigantopelta aegis]